ncbi:UDP-N-acetylmuramoyl-tripeptide--D-alanyl-D-alanine ligase [subsurface metagenome]
MTFDELLALVSSNNALCLCADSRLVKAGDIFVAMKGSVYDGHDFIGQALDRGAKYIVCQHGRRQNTEPRTLVRGEDKRQKKYEIVIIDDSPQAAALLAQAGRGNPASKLTNLAVTGTNAAALNFMPASRF